MRPRGENVEYDKLRDRYDAHAAKVAALEADRDLLSQKACEAVLHYRTALGKLTDSFKYSTEVVTIAREALAHSTSITSETGADGG